MGEISLWLFHCVVATERKSNIRSVILSPQISYNQRMVIRIAQSTSRHLISVSGQGSEPKLEFSSTLIEFGPVLPHSAGDEKEVVVKNPSAFPVEIYSLEFDKQYLEEEKVSNAHNK